MWAKRTEGGQEGEEEGEGGEESEGEEGGGGEEGRGLWRVPRRRAVDGSRQQAALQTQL